MRRKSPEGPGEEAKTNGYGTCVLALVPVQSQHVKGEKLNGIVHQCVITVTHQPVKTV